MLRNLKALGTTRYVPGERDGLDMTALLSASAKARKKGAPVYHPVAIVSGHRG